jgi:predicted nucleic acid-binding Zn ribbon protein
MSWRDSDDDLDPAEFPDEDEAEDGDETVPCPHCFHAVYEDAERCPGCGAYLSREDAPSRRRHPWWLVVGVIVCLLVVLRWVVH